MTATTAGGARTTTRWDMIALAILSGVMVGLAVGKVPSALPVISAEFGLDLVTAGWLASIFFAFGAGGSVLMGMVGGRLDARTLMVGGLVILALGGLVGAASPGGGMLLALRVVEGISFSAIAVSAPRVVFDMAVPKDRDLALGIWSAYMPAGMATALVLTPFLIGPLGWRGVWIVTAAAVLVVAVATFLMTTPQRWPDQPRGDKSMGFDWAGARIVMTRQALWLYCGAFFLFTIEWFAVAAWLPTFLIETQGRSDTAAALFSALVVATNVIGNLAGAWLMYRGAPRWLLIAGANVIMGVTAVFILGAFSPDGIKVPLAILFSVGSGVLPAAVFAGAAIHAPRPPLIALASGFAVQGAAIGMLLGPPLMAFVVGGLGGWEQAWWVMLVGPAIGVAISARILTLERT